MTMTRELAIQRCEELLAKWDKATPGPWVDDGVVVWADAPGYDTPVCIMPSRYKGGLCEPSPDAPLCGLDNAALISASRSYLPTLVAWVRDELRRHQEYAALQSAGGTKTICLVCKDPGSGYAPPACTGKPRWGTAR